MAINEELAHRVREMLSDRDDVKERKMFGGLCFMVSGHMACGITKSSDLMIRTGKEKHEQALAEPHARPMDFTGRPMKGMVFVGEEGYTADDDLQKWVGYGVDYVSTLPPK